MESYDIELRRLLYYPFKIIKYNQTPKVIKLKFHPIAKPLHEAKLQENQKTRKYLNLPFEPKEILKEYKKWVDSIQILKVINEKDQQNYFLELKKDKKSTKYLLDLYKKLINENLKKNKIQREFLIKINPWVEYHIMHYNKLQNNYRESFRNYYLPIYIKNVNHKPYK